MFKFCVQNFAYWGSLAVAQAKHVFGGSDALKTTRMVTNPANLAKAAPAQPRPTLAAWLVLVIGIPLSVFAFTLTKDTITRVANLRFEREAIHASGVIETRLASYTQVLYAMRALFADEEFVDRRRFHHFVGSMDLTRRFPGVLSLNYAAHVPAKGKAAFEKMVRADTSMDLSGYPNFSIKPPGDRNEHFVVVYLEPMSGYEFAFGLDLGKSPIATDANKVARAIQSGRDTGRLTSSAQPLKIRRDKEIDYLAMRLAVYRFGMPVDTVEQRRTAYMGSVGAGFDVDSVMQAAIGEKLLPHMRVRLYDMGAATGDPDSASSAVKQRLLFDSKPLPQPAVDSAAMAHPKPVFAHRVPLVIADRNWDLEFSAHANSAASLLDRYSPVLVLAGGLVLTLLLFSVVYTLATSRSRAMTMASEMTSELRASEASLAEAQELAHLGNWAIDRKTGAMTWSAETYRILGLEPRSTPEIYTESLQLVHEDDRDAVDKELRDCMAFGCGGNVEHRIQRPNGEIRWVHTIIKPVAPNYAGAVPGTIMDITERKLAENKLLLSHQQLQALSRRQVELQEAACRRYSAELHDVVGQNLAALGFNLELVKIENLKQENSLIATRIEDAAELLRSTADTVEHVISELRPPMLDDYGLFSALQWYAKQFAERTGICVRVHGDETIARLTPAAEIALFRVTQEALNNVARHARARHVDITLECIDSHHVLTIVDDGIGRTAVSLSRERRESDLKLATVADRRRPGMGMVTMRERVQAIGGAFEAGSASGAGFTVKLRVPS